MATLRRNVRKRTFCLRFDSDRDLSLFGGVPIWPRAKTFGQKIHEGAHLWRQVTGVRVDRVQGHVLSNEFVEHRHQSADVQVATDDESRQIDEAKPANRRDPERVAIVGSHATADINRPWLPI